MTDSSEIPGFYKLSPAERMRVVQKLTGIADEEAKTLGNTGGLPPEVADRMIENVVGGLTIPLGIATNFLINGKDYLIPMASRSRRSLPQRATPRRWRGSRGVSG